MKRFILLLPFLLSLTACQNPRVFQSPLIETRDKTEGRVRFEWGGEKSEENSEEKPRKISDRKKLRNTARWIKKNRKDFRVVSKPLKKKKKKMKNRLLIVIAMLFAFCSLNATQPMLASKSPRKAINRVVKEKEKEKKEFEKKKKEEKEKKEVKNK